MAITGNPLPAPYPPDPTLGVYPARRLLASNGAEGTQTGLADLAARLLSLPGAPVAAQIVLLTDVQTVAGSSGLPAGAQGLGTDDSLSRLVLAARGPLLVDDARADQRVCGLPLVAGGEIGSYLGVPLADRNGAQVGVLCVLGPAPRSWSSYDVALLTELADAVMAQLELAAVSAEFQTSQLRWEAAIDAAGIGSFVWNIVSGRLEWDERLQRLFGYAPGEFEPLIDEGFRRVHPDDRPALDAAIEHALTACTDFRAEYRIVLPDGSLRWVASRGRGTAGPDGHAAQLVGTAYDISEVRTARDEAARLLETMATGFAAVDRDWRVRYVNAEGSRVIGMAAPDIVGKNMWDAFPGLRELEFGRQYEHAMTSGEIVEFEAYYHHLNGWFEVRAVPDETGLSLYFLDVTGRHAAQERAAAATERLALLAQVGADLADAGLATEDAVGRLAQLTVPLLADWCVISVVAGERVRDVGCWHVDPDMRPAVDAFVAERLVGRKQLEVLEHIRQTQRPAVVVSGATQVVMPRLVSDVAVARLAELAPESYVVVPLMAHGNLTGMMTLCRSAGRPPMTDEEIATASDVAARAGMALDNARLYAEQRGLAEGLQRSLLTTPPEPDHCQITVRYVPAAEAASVGGDWFDSFLQADGATVLVIGDVMGHDTVAAAAMGQVRGLLRGIAWYSGAAPAEVLTGLDAAMEGLQVQTTATAVVARLEQNDDERERGVTRLRWSNAGHPPPMALNPDGTVTVLSGLDADLLLGIDARTARTESAVALDRGSTVLLYTDGLVERRGQDLDEGLALLRETLTGMQEIPLEELCDQLLRRLLPDDAQDDVALVAVRLHRQDRPRPAEAGPERVPPTVPAD